MAAQVALRFTVAACGILASAATWAQAATPANASADLPVLGTPSEAAQRQALSPYRFIQNAGQMKIKAAAPVAAAAPAPVTAVAAPAASKRASPPVPAAVPATAPALAKAAEPVPAPAAAPAPAALPAAVQVAAAAPSAIAQTAPPPAPAPVAVARKELIAISQDPPSVSNALLAEIQRGSVKLRFDVNPDGSTSAVQVAHSSHRKLNSAAVAAVSKWRFQPIEATRTVEIDMAFSND